MADSLDKSLTDLTKNLSKTNKELIKQRKAIGKQSQIALAEQIGQQSSDFSSWLSSQKLKKAELAYDKTALINAERLHEELMNNQKSAIDRDVELKNASFEIALLRQEQEENKLRTDINQQVDAEKLSEKLSLAIEKEGERRQEIEKSMSKGIEDASEKLKIQQDKYASTIKEAGESQGFDKFSGGLKTLTGGLVDIGGVLDDVVKFGNAIKNVGTGFLQFTANLSETFQGIGALTNIRSDIVKAKKQLTAMFPNLTGFIGSIFTGIGKVFSSIAGMIGEIPAMIGGMITSIGGMFATIGTMFTTLFASIASTFTLMMTSISTLGLVGTLQAGLTMIGTGLSIAFGTIFSLIKTVFLAPVKMLAFIGKALVNTVKLFRIAMLLISGAGTAFLAAVTSPAAIMIGVGAVIALAVGLLVWGIFKLLEKFPEIGVWISDTSETFVTAIKDGIQKMLDVITDIWDTITGFASRQFDNLKRKIFGDDAVDKKNDFRDRKEFIKESGLYTEKGAMQNSTVDMSKLDSASDTDIATILEDNDLKSSDRKALQAELVLRQQDRGMGGGALIDLIKDGKYSEFVDAQPPLVDGNQIAQGTTEVAEGDKQKGDMNVVTSSSQTSTVFGGNTFNVAPPTPRDVDPSANRIAFG